VINPKVMKGSSGICPTIASISDIASPWAPPTMLARLVPIDAPSCKRRLDFRSWKKVFQSSMSADLGDDDVDAVFDCCPDVLRGSVVSLVGGGTVEAYRTICLEGVLNTEGVLILLLLWEVVWGSCGWRCDGGAV
jgi:hypothetical protein